MTGSTVSIDFKAIDEILESCNYSKQYKTRASELVERFNNGDCNAFILSKEGLLYIINEAINIVKYKPIHIFINHITTNTPISTNILVLSD